MNQQSSNQSLINRACRFPLRAVLGLEPLWVVFLAGSVTLFIVFKSITVGLGSFAGLHPVPSYVLPLGYLLVILFTIVQIWFFISLWQSAGRLKVAIGKILVRILVLLAAIFLLLGDINVVRVIQDTFAPATTSVFQN